jgi:hypothetical protein
MPNQKPDMNQNNVNTHVARIEKFVNLIVITCTTSIRTELRVAIKRID